MILEVKRYSRLALIFVAMEVLGYDDRLGNLEMWLKEHGGIPAVIVLSKIDLVHLGDTEKITKLRQYCAQHKLDLCEISSKTGKGVPELFEKLKERLNEEIEKDLAKQNTQSLRSTTKSVLRKIVTKKIHVIERNERNESKIDSSVLVDMNELLIGRSTDYFQTKYAIDADTTFKIFSKVRVVTVDNLSNTALEFYMISDNDFKQLVRECKRVYTKSNFREVEYKQLDASLIFKRRCQYYAIKPSAVIVNNLQIIDENYNCLNLRGVIREQVPKQKRALFESLIWIFTESS